MLGGEAPLVAYDELSFEPDPAGLVLGHARSEIDHQPDVEVLAELHGHGDGGELDARDPGHEVGTQAVDALLVGPADVLGRADDNSVVTITSRNLFHLQDIRR